jgi:hypothetical protein
LEDLGVDGSITSSGNGMGGMELIDLAQGRDGWWALLNAVMNLWVRCSAGNFLTS